MAPKKTKGQAIPENIQRAFDKYCACGGNKSQTLRELEAEGHKIARQTLYRWIDAYRFDERMTDIDLRRQDIQAIARDARAELLLDVLTQKEAYERAFAALAPNAAPGAGVMFAYTGLIRVALRLASELAPGATNAGVTKEDKLRKVAEVLRSEYGIGE
jgi:hypothetical protein